MSLTVKLESKTGGVRRIALKTTTGGEFEALIAAHGSKANVSFVDDEGDRCVVSCQAEMVEALRFFAEKGKCPRFTVESVGEQQQQQQQQQQDIKKKPSVPVSENKTVASAPVEEKKKNYSFSAAFVKDVNYPDGTVVAPGQVFTKTWTVKNTGNTPWEKIRLCFRNGFMQLARGQQRNTPVKNLAPGESCDVSVRFVAPKRTSKFSTSFTLSSSDPNAPCVTNPLKLWCTIQVKRALSAKFVRDVTLADNTVCQPNANLVKTWAFTNDGSRAWPKGCVLQYRSGRLTPETKSVALPCAAVGETIEVSVPIIASRHAGKHKAVFVLKCGNKMFSGDFRAWCVLTVKPDVTKALSPKEFADQLPAMWEHDLVRAVAQRLLEEQTIHVGVQCDSCFELPIRGVRYRCSVCADYDLCGDCEARGDHPACEAERKCGKCSDGAQHPADHVFLKIKQQPASECRKNARQLARAARTLEEKKSSALSVASYIKDVTLPDGALVPAGSVQKKTWRLRNQGKHRFAQGTRVVYVCGKLIPQEQSYPVEQVLPGQVFDVSVDILMPSAGSYTGYYRLKDPRGKLFGPRLWLDVRVEDPAPEVQVKPTAPEAETKVQPTAPEAEVTTPPADKYDVAVKALLGMGYNDERMLRDLVLAANGDLSQVVSWLSPQ